MTSCVGQLRQRHGVLLACPFLVLIDAPTSLGELLYFTSNKQAWLAYWRKAHAAQQLSSQDKIFCRSVAVEANDFG